MATAKKTNTKIYNLSGRKIIIQIAHRQKIIFPIFPGSVLVTPDQWAKLVRNRFYKFYANRGVLSPRSPKNLPDPPVSTTEIQAPAELQPGSTQGATVKIDHKVTPS